MLFVSGGVYHIFAALQKYGLAVTDKN